MTKLLPNLHTFNTSFMLILFAVLAACGGSSGSSGGDEEDEPSAPNAYFIDSGVSGLDYSSDSYQGKTNTLGAFEFAPGEITTFSYQGLTIGSVTTSDSSRVFTPLDIFSTTDINDQRVKNLLVLLQSLDIDQNPNNGIYLRDFTELEQSAGDPAFGLDLSNLDLSISSSNFYDALNTVAFETDNPNIEADAPINEADALEHFELTLSGINAEFSLIGTWIERNDNGEIRYKHTYDANGSMTAVEYDDCTNEDGSHSPTLSWVERNCDERNDSYTYTFNDKTLSIFKDGTQVDTCYVLSSSKTAYDSTCSTDTLIHLERVVESLSDDIIEDTYRLVNPDSSGYANLTFNVSDHTGAFNHYSNGSIDESGTLTSWSISNNQLTYNYEIIGGSSGTETLTLRSSNDGIQGGLATDSASENDTQLLIPNFNPDYATTITSSTLTYGVYDGVTGKCKGLLKFGSSYDEASGDYSTGYTRSTRSGEVCSYSDISSEQSSTYEILSGGLISMNIDNEYCWPVSLNVTGENGIYVLAACSKNGDTTFTYEYWYSL